MVFGDQALNWTDKLFLYLDASVYLIHDIFSLTA